MVPSVKLVSVASAVPPHRIEQSDAAAFAHQAFSARYTEFDRLSRVFETAGILSRYAVRPLDWYLSPMGWQERNAAYLEGACLLFEDAATKALEAAAIAPQMVDIIVTVSSTGIATPSLEALVADRLGFRPDVERVPVFGLGCAGGVSGLALAARLAKAQPGKTVLLIAVELCSLSFRRDKLSKANIVATALFGDGAAACVLRAGDAGMASVEMAGQHRWPDTLGIMGWDVDTEGLGVIFDRDIPPFAKAHLAPAVAGILERGGLTVEDIDRFTCHPGGAKVIAAIEQGLSLEQGSLDHERTVLSDYGNMSAPTALFVLERLAAHGLPPRTLLTALGPGFTASCVSLQAAA